MNAAMKAEFKKLFSVRSTYLWSLVGFLLVSFFSFWVWGHNYGNDMSAGKSVANLYTAGTITQIANTVAPWGAIIALLLVTHEYRYNTIIYTLTASNSRSKVYLSKTIAPFVFVLFFSLITTIAALVLLKAGLSMGHHNLPHQDVNYLTYIGKSVFLCEGFALAGVLFATLIRNQVGALVAFFILPNTFEGLLGLLLKHNSVYMPFTALSQVIQAPSITARGVNEAATGYLSPVKGGLVFACYFLVFWFVSWYLFLRRDAQ